MMTQAAVPITPGVPLTPTLSRKRERETSPPPKQTLSRLREREGPTAQRWEGEGGLLRWEGEGSCRC